MSDTVKIQFVVNNQPEIGIHTDQDSITKWFEDCYAYIHNTLVPQMQADPNNETLNKATSQLAISDKVVFDTEAVFEAIDIAEQTYGKTTIQVADGVTVNKIKNKELAVKLENIKVIAKNMAADVSAINAKLETKNNASMSLMMLMNDKTFQDIQEIEKQVIYRRFYFPGGEPKKIVITDTSELKRWDPRAIDEYIALARQQGFHRFFIYYNGFDFKPISFTQAARSLKNCVNWNMRRISEDGACDKLEVCGIIAGLIYFDKVESFFEEMTTTGGNESMLNRIWDNYSDTIDPMIEKIANVITHQTQRNFKKNNYGWMAEDDALAFDSAKYVAELVTLKAQYDMYKDRVWKILEGLNALEVCTNYTNITGNNLSIDQKMQCALSIEGKGKNAPTVNEESTIQPNTPTQSSAQQLPTQSTIATTASTQSIIPSNIMQPNMPQPTTSQQSTAQSILSDKELFYAVLIVTIILFALLLFLMFRKPKTPQIIYKQTPSLTQ